MLKKRKTDDQKIRDWVASFFFIVFVVFVIVLVIAKMFDAGGSATPYTPSCAKCGSTRGYYQDSSGHALAPRYFSRCKDCDAVK